MSKPTLNHPLAQVRGLGSAHDGTHHFWLQRLTALALVPLTIWFVASVVCKLTASHEEFVLWMKSIPVATAMVIFLIATLWHAALGLQVVLEDYVHTHMLRTLSIILVKFACFTLAVMGVLAVLKISLGA